MFETWLREGVVETWGMSKALERLRQHHARDIFVGALATANLLKMLPAYSDTGASLDQTTWSEDSTLPSLSISIKRHLGLYAYPNEF